MLNLKPIKDRLKRLTEGYYLHDGKLLISEVEQLRKENAKLKKALRKVSEVEK